MFSYFLNENLEYTKQMEDWFEKRTKKHIHLVQKYASRVSKLSPKFKGLVDRAREHDSSKYGRIEKIPYIFITWSYHQKALGKKYNVPNDIKEEMNKATLYHVRNNRHHPEYFDRTASINQEDRDKSPDKIVDATRMTTVDIAEMVCDWLAMSEELNSNPLDWAKKNINIRWKFTDEQVNLIYDIIKKVWK